MVISGGVFQDFARGASFVKGRSARALSSASLMARWLMAPETRSRLAKCPGGLFNTLTG